MDRKALLEKLLPAGNRHLRYSEHFEENGGLVLDHACRLSLEGVISKVRDSKYVSGRKGSWVKSKCAMRQEFVIGGYTLSSSSDHAIGSWRSGFMRTASCGMSGALAPATPLKWPKCCLAA